LAAVSEVSPSAISARLIVFTPKDAFCANQADYVSNAAHALATAVSAKPSTDPVRTAHVGLVTALAGKPPWPMLLFADADYLEDRADHLKKVLDAASAYVTTTVNDTGRNVPGGLIGSIRHAADNLAGRDA
jgi:hypothetical protein